MEEEDVDVVAHLITVAMNPDEGEQARETFAFHFRCRRIGLDDGRTYYVVPAEKSGMQGIVGLHRYMWGPPENVWLAWFAVDPKLRGTGLGKILMEHVVQRASELGFARIYIETYSTPEFADARTFYQAKGFVPAGIVSSYLPTGGDMVVYAKELIHDV